MAIVVEFNAKVMLEDALILASLKRWTEAFARHHRQASKHGTILVPSVKVILNADKLMIGRRSMLRSAYYHWIGFFLIKVNVIATVAERVLGSVERFPHERTDWSLRNVRWGFQHDWVDV
jgi:hypothetical protein